MKKITAMILSLILCLSLVPSALAETHLREEDMIQLTEYSYELALKYIGDREWEGLSRNIKQVNAVFWLPNTLPKIDLPQDAIDAGVLNFYSSETLSVQVSLVDYDGISLEKYLEIVTEQGYQNARLVPVNDVDFIIYDEPVEGCEICRVAATILPDGQFLEFIYFSADADLDAQIEGSIATIRFKK